MEKDSSLRTILYVFLLLIVSNVFVISAWYLNLKFDQLGIVSAILMSWGIAFCEYWFHIPANRLGHKGPFTTAKLEIAHLIVNMSVFVVLLKVYFNKVVSFNEALAFLCILGAIVSISFDYKDLDLEQLIDNQ